MKYFQLAIIFILVVFLAGCGKSVPVNKEEFAPDFTLKNTEGVEVNLHSFKDKTMVIVVFWATWCPFCIEEIAELNKMAEEFKDKVKIFGIDIKEDSKKVIDFSMKKDIRYEILLDTAGEVAQKYKIVGIPTNVLIDKEGKILYKGHSVAECRKKLIDEAE